VAENLAMDMRRGSRGSILWRSSQAPQNDLVINFI